MDDKHAANYRLAEAKFNKRVQELAESPDLATLRSEIAVLRGLVEENLSTSERRNLPIIRDLISAIGQLVKAHRVAEIEADRLLEKSVVIELGKSLAQCIVAELTDKFPGWEDSCDRISEKMISLIASASNRKSAQ